MQIVNRQVKEVQRYTRSLVDWPEEDVLYRTTVPEYYILYSRGHLTSDDINMDADSRPT